MDGNNATDDVATKAEQKLKDIINASQLSALPCGTAADFRKWFLQHFTNDNCKTIQVSLETFGVFYINAVRKATYQHLRTLSSNYIELPSSSTPSPSAIIAEKPIFEQPQNKSTVQTTPLAQDINTYSATSTNCSTPLRRGNGHRRSIERSFGAASNSSYEKSRNSTSDGSFCLGDFIVNTPNGSGRHGNSHKKKSKSSTTTPVQQNTPKSGSGTKPKKRVVPISIGGKSTTLNTCGDNSSPFGVHNSSFNRECNNLFMQTPTMEVSDMAEVRKSLKRDLNEVSTALKAATPTKTPSKVSDITQAMNKVKLGASKVDELLKITNDTRSVLRLLANIYGFFLDINFMTNILNEFSFVLNLLNANCQQNWPSLSKEKEIEPLVGLETLQSSINSIYFAVCVLECQQHALTLLDTKSLGVVLQCERLELLAPLLREKLSSVYEQNQTLAYQLDQQQQIMAADSSFKNVCFQEESDSRKFFPSANEFDDFKTQRDLFYNTLRVWEKHHLNPAWSFDKELASKVRDLFHQSEHPVNMEHFSKLFVSQLLVSASDKTSPEDLGFDNEDVDLQKFNKLAQRLVKPSNYSVDYQFPREQAFFRDFIVESRSLPFIEQLKMVLYGELIKLNDSTFEHMNLSFIANEERDHEIHNGSEFIVEPTVLSSMLILAKFLGFVTALPYLSGALSASVGTEVQNTALLQRNQIKMRQLFHAPFDVCQILEEAVASGRLLIALPWLVQYMVMLDEITLQLNSYVSALHKMFRIYAAIGSAHNEKIVLQHTIAPSSAFIVRCCLGWLFEQKPGIAADYHDFRATFLDFSTVIQTISAAKPAAVDHQAYALLESVFAVACPYLAEFRVSIMPAKHALTKYVSRSGRYRHITPSILTKHQTDQNPQTLLENVQENSSTASKQRQRRLMESFFHTQNSSMRRLIVFLTERTYKCVIKDAQYQILLPSKSAAESRVNEINSQNYHTIFEEVLSIYSAARRNAIQQWDNEVPSMLKKRVTLGLDALLPVETTSAVRSAYAWRIQSDANIKISQFRQMHLFKHNFYFKDLFRLVDKIYMANQIRLEPQQNGSAQQTTELKLSKETPSISDLLNELQHWMYITSGTSNFNMSPKYHLTINCTNPTTIDAALIDFITRLTDSFENILPTIYFRLIGAGLVQVLQHLIASPQPAALTPALIQHFCDFCLDERMRKADECTTATGAQTKQFDSCNSTAVTTIYHALITAPFIQSLNGRSVCFEKLKELLLSMIQKNVISIDYVNELFIGIFKLDLCQVSLNETSRLLSELADEVVNFGCDANNCDNDDLQKSKLLMEVLADFSRDIDDF